MQPSHSKTLKLRSSYIDEFPKHFFLSKCSKLLQP